MTKNKTDKNGRKVAVPKLLFHADVEQTGSPLPLQHGDTCYCNACASKRNLQSIPVHIVDDMKQESYYDGFRDGAAHRSTPQGDQPPSGEAKPRCEYELFLEEYYGFDPNKVHEKYPIETDYGHLVGLLCMFNERKNQPANREQGEASGDAFISDIKKRLRTVDQESPACTCKEFTKQMALCPVCDKEKYEQTMNQLTQAKQPQKPKTKTFKVLMYMGKYMDLGKMSQGLYETLYPELFDMEETKETIGNRLGDVKQYAGFTDEMCASFYRNIQKCDLVPVSLHPQPAKPAEGGDMEAALEKYCTPYGKANPQTYAYLDGLATGRAAQQSLPHKEPVTDERIAECASFYAKTITDDYSEREDISEHFIAGAKAFLPAPQAVRETDIEALRENIENAFYSTNRFTTSECEQLAEIIIGCVQPRIQELENVERNLRTTIDMGDEEIKKLKKENKQLKEAIQFLQDMNRDSNEAYITLLSLTEHGSDEVDDKSILLKALKEISQLPTRSMEWAGGFKERVNEIAVEAIKKHKKANKTK